MKPWITPGAVLLCLTLGSVAVPAGADDAPAIGLFASLDAHHPFWASMRRFEEAVGQDLGLQSRWYFANSDQFLAEQQIGEATAGEHPIQAAVVTDFKAQGPRFLKLLEQRRVPTMSFVGFDLEHAGMPRRDNRYWIGAISMDEEAVGHILATTLLDEAKRLHLTAHDGKIHVVGISGDVNSTLGQQREKGLQRAIAERRGEAVLDQVVPTLNWSEPEGESKAVGLLSRYPEATVVWSANDSIALGVLKGARQAGRQPGQTLVTGGIDWVPEAIDRVIDGQMVCSVGGLKFQAGWAALLLYDYLHGHDFAPELGTVVKIPYALLTRESAAKYRQVLVDDRWDKVDFSAMSKARNPKLRHYDFSLERLFKAAQR